MYDVCLEFDGDTSLVVEEGAIFGGDGGYGTYTLINCAVYDTTLGYGAGWVETTVDCGVNSNGNGGGYGGGGTGFSTDVGAVMALLRSVAVLN